MLGIFSVSSTFLFLRISMEMPSELQPSGIAAVGRWHPTIMGTDALLEGSIIAKRATKAGQIAFIASRLSLRCRRKSREQSNSVVTPR